MLQKFLLLFFISQIAFFHFRSKEKTAEYRVKWSLNSVVEKTRDKIVDHASKSNKKQTSKHARTAKTQDDNKKKKTSRKERKTESQRKRKTENQRNHTHVN